MDGWVGRSAEVRTPYKDQGIGVGEAHHDLQVPALESEDGATRGTGFAPSDGAQQAQEHDDDDDDDDDDNDNDSNDNRTPMRGIRSIEAASKQANEQAS